MMSTMNEYSKSVFNNKELLREKLRIFLDTTDAAKVETYAQACERFFACGAKQRLGFSATWSWPAFLVGPFFFWYRKSYLGAAVAFLVQLILSLLSFILFGLCGKYVVAKKFATLLNFENDALLQAKGGKNIWAIPAGIAINIAILAFVIGVLLNFPSQDEHTGAISDLWNSFGSVEADEQTTPNPSLDKIFTLDMLGSDIAYLQQFTGIPKETWCNGSRTYKVGECIVTAHTETEKVLSLGLEVNPRCTFDFGKMFGSTPNAVWAHQLTYGKVENILGEGAHFSSDCIYACGNAEEPSVYITWHGSRAENYMDVQLELGYTGKKDDKVTTLIPAWAASMESQEGEDYVIGLGFNESTKYDALAATLFREVPVTRIQFGHGIREGGEPEGDCS